MNCHEFDFRSEAAGAEAVGMADKTQINLR